MKESQLKTKAKKAALQQFKNLLIMPTEDLFHKGYPDWVVVYRGRTIFVEWKTPKGPVSRMQEYFISEIKQCGGEAYICRETEEFLNILKGGDTNAGNNDRA